MSRIGEFIRARWREREDYSDTRSWLWNLYSRLVQKTPAVPWPGRGLGVRVRVPGIERPFEARLGTTDFAILDQVFRAGEYRRINELPRPLVRTILDLGSNAGYSIRLWREWFPDARIVGVEPDESNFQTMRKNLDAQGAAPGDAVVRLFRCCVAARRGDVFLSRGRNQSGYSMNDREQGGVKVSALTVADVLREAGLDGPVDLLKCDIEGAEREVFADCSAWIGRVRHIVAETHPPYRAEDLLRDIQRCGGRFRLVEVVDAGMDEERAGRLQVAYLAAA